ncbi:zf-TFIIB domain-containing protein [Aliikangiella sp. G2MR2-5]|uniref:zf-TFIIB domain-containing protein n=1 Tax=Aliikangiella sp. G2MR2-5 TaxID=2788943 RepID=UPI0018AADFD9|nr:zf-TFIIB domain-containing protein [Aliikangiella sp. G2MR2-5]
MNCTKCKQGSLSPSFIEGLFRAHTCTDCGGNWILIEDYVAWKERNPDVTFKEDAVFEVDDTKTALLCPVSGTIMQKFKVSHDSEHKLDYSPQVGGVWLDRGEWEFLKSANLAGSLNRIFTEFWQKTIREASAKETFTEIYKEKFGEADYLKAKEIREWLTAHPCKADLRAYILAEDPYSAER